MKHYLTLFIFLATFALLAVTSVQAKTEKMVIAVKTDNFELTETDVSTLTIGEAQTIETDSGKVIEILRTTDGVELYVDGELLEMNFDELGLNGEHMIKKHLEVICESDEDCDTNVFIISGGDNEATDWVTDDDVNVFIHKEIELSCTSEEEGTSCSDKMVWISDGEDIDLEEFHEMHASGEDHKVIVIKKEIFQED